MTSPKSAPDPANPATNARARTNAGPVGSTSPAFESFFRADPQTSGRRPASGRRTLLGA